MSEEFALEEFGGGDEELSLLETLDHVLDKGLVVAGDVVISVANIDLIYLGLNALLGSVETVNETLERRERLPTATPGETPRADARGATGVDTQRAPNVLLSEHSPSPLESAETASEDARGEREVEQLRHAPAPLPERINVDARSVEQGLAKLVLTLIELISRLLEKQAVRRMEGGRLSDSQVEELGLALMKLEEKMRELKGQFGLEDEDLNLDLGPVGKLI